MKTYTIVIEGKRHGEYICQMFTQKGFNRDHALTALFRACMVDPFIQDRNITVKENKNVSS